MAASDYWDSQDLKAVAAGGLVREDVMDKIWDISSIPLPFMDNVREDSHDNSYCEWTQDEHHLLGAVAGTTAEDLLRSVCAKLGDTSAT